MLILFQLVAKFGPIRFGRSAQLSCEGIEPCRTCFEAARNSRKILRQRGSPTDPPCAQNIVLEARILGELAHRERAISQRTLHEADDVFSHGVHPWRGGVHKTVDGPSCVH